MIKYCSVDKMDKLELNVSTHTHTHTHQFTGNNGNHFHKYYIMFMNT